MNVQIAGRTKKEVIIEEAAKLFREKGYAAASMRDLATKVGLEPSSLYSHIRSKEEILSKICMDTAHKFVEGMREIQMRECTPKEKVESLIDLHIRIAMEDISSFSVFNDEWRFLSQKELDAFLELRRSYQNEFTDIILNGIKSENFRNYEPVNIVNLILTSMRQVYFWKSTESDFNREIAAKDLKTFILSGLCKS